MKFLDLFKKKKKIVATLPEPSTDMLPPPPSIENSKLPAISETNKKTIKFPTLAKLPTEFETKAYNKEKRILAERETLKTIQPIFIEGEDFRDIITEIQDSKNILKKITIFADKFEDIHNLKENKFEKLEKNIETIQRKLIFMDKTLFK